jgi:membrane fusion protein, multidrug efflux system
VRRSLASAAAAGLVVLSSGCSRRDPAPAGAPGPASGAAVPVTVATAERRDVPEILRAIGTVEPAETVVLRPQVAGQLLEAKFTEGQDVKAGEVLLLIDPRPFQAEVHEAEANVARTRALAADATRWLERLEQAESGGATSSRETEQARAAAEAAQAAVLAAEAQLEQAQLNLAYCTITSPINGRAGSLLVKPGNVVKENETALVEVNQIAPINAVFAVPEKHLGTVLERQNAGALQVEAAPPERPDRVSQGRLAFVDNKVDSATGTIRLRAWFANDDGRLWPGEFVNVALTLGVRRGAVTIPARALQASQRGTFVYVVTSGAAEERPVKAADNEGQVVVVTEGLSGGETVVTDGQLRLFPGAKVQAQNAGPAVPGAAAGGRG